MSFNYALIITYMIHNFKLIKKKTFKFLSNNKEASKNIISIIKMNILLTLILLFKYS